MDGGGRQRSVVATRARLTRVLVAQGTAQAVGSRRPTQTDAHLRTDDRPRAAGVCVAGVRGGGTSPGVTYGQTTRTSLGIDHTAAASSHTSELQAGVTNRNFCRIVAPYVSRGTRLSGWSTGKLRAVTGVLHATCMQQLLSNPFATARVVATWTHHRPHMHGTRGECC